LLGGRERCRRELGLISGNDGPPRRWKIVAESNLITAKYYEDIAAASDVNSVGKADGPLTSSSAMNGWERIASRFSFLVGGALVVTRATLAIGYCTTTLPRFGAQAKKSPSSNGMLLRLGGIDLHQTFDKVVSEINSPSRNDWEEKFRSSPVHGLGQKGV